MRYAAARPETAPIDRIVAASRIGANRQDSRGDRVRRKYVATKQFTEIGYFTAKVYVLINHYLRTSSPANERN